MFCIYSAPVIIPSMKERHYTLCKNIYHDDTFLLISNQDLVYFQPAPAH